MKKKIFAPLFAIVCALTVPVMVFAEDDLYENSYESSTNDIDPGGDPDEIVNTPIDGGLSLLIAAGIGVGTRKAYKKKKQ